MFCSASNISSENRQFREKGSFSRAKTGFSTDVNSTLGPNVNPGWGRKFRTEAFRGRQPSLGLRWERGPFWGALVSGSGATVPEEVLTRRGARSWGWGGDLSRWDQMSRKSNYPKVMSICLFGFAFSPQFWPLGNSAAALGAPETSLPWEPQKPDMLTAHRQTQHGHSLVGNGRLYSKGGLWGGVTRSPRTPPPKSSSLPQPPYF